MPINRGYSDNIEFAAVVYKMIVDNYSDYIRKFNTLNGVKHGLAQYFYDDDESDSEACKTYQYVNGVKNGPYFARHDS